MVLVFVNCFWLESSIFLKPKIRQLFEICWHGTCTRRFRFVFQRIQFFRRVFLMFCCMSFICSVTIHQFRVYLISYTLNAATSFGTLVWMLDNCDTI